VPEGAAASWAAAYEHLRAADPVMARLLDANGVPDERPPRTDVYAALVRTIVGQQLSTRSARAIYGRLLERVDGHPPTPQQILDDDPDELRVAAGLSHAKVRYLRSLAEHVATGELDIDRLTELSDEDAIAELVAINGIGEWTAHIFLMFTLQRPDVLAVGDLGIRRAVERAYDLPALPTPAELTKIAEPWRPYRTAACVVLWTSLANAPA
jgi:DNA-3-methyladenine glycosylase II